MMTNRTLLVGFTRDSVGAHLFFAAAAVGGYVLLYLLLHPRTGLGLAALSAIPVTTVGWWWGMLGGVLAGMLSFPLNTLLLNAVGHQPGGWDVIVRVGGFPGSVALVVIGMVVGWMRNLRANLSRRVHEHGQVEQTLRDRELRLQMLLGQVPAILWTTDDQLRFTSSVGAGLAHLALQPNQVAGMSLYEYFQTGDPEFFPIAAHRRALSGESASYEMTWEERSYRVHVEPFRDPTDRIAGTIGAALDITERVHAEQILRDRDATLEAQVRELGAIAEASAALRGAESMPELASAIAMQTSKLLGADAAFLNLLDEERDQIRIVGAVGVAPDVVGRSHGGEEGISGLVIRTGQIYRTADLSSDPRVVHKDLVRGLGPATCVPLRTSAGQVVGTVVVARRARAEGGDEQLPAEAERILSTLAEIAGNALQRVRMHEALEEAYIEAVLALSNAMDARDTYTAHHSRRLATLAVAAARALGCSDEEIRHIHWGALLHDLGKLAVPDAILRKQGRLAVDEWAIVKRHPEVGAQIVSPVRRFRPVLPIIRHHHEHWDGSGYPAGLVGEAIPLGARILAVADAYVAMTEDRVYRKALSRQEAVAELRRHANMQFDPHIVQLFCALEEGEIAHEDVNPSGLEVAGIHATGLATFSAYPAEASDGAKDARRDFGKTRRSNGEGVGVQGKAGRLGDGGHGTGRILD